MTLRQKIEANGPTLQRCMDLSPDLLSRLRSFPLIKDRVSFIDQQRTDDDKVKALLSELLKLPDSMQGEIMDRLVSALRLSGQEHVANIFRRESNKVPMSDEHYRTLMTKTDQLCKFLDPENGLLNTLTSAEIVSHTDANYIRAMTGYNEKARKLIEILMKKSDDTFNGFINALNQTRHSHVAYILTRRGNSRPLKQEHIDRLETSERLKLVQMIDSKSSGLITALMNKGVFSDFDKQRVTGVQPDIADNRNEIILDLVARKSQSDFFNFISALNDTDQTHVAVQLIGADVVAKIKTVYESGADGGRIRDVDAELLEYMREVFQSNDIVVRRINQFLTREGVTVSGVRQGCIEITFTCKNVESLNNFRNHSGDLERMLNEAFCSQFASKGLESLKLKISNEEFEQCADKFTRWMPMSSEHRQALLSSEKWLLNNMKLSGDFLDRLSLCKRRRQAIKRPATRQKKVKVLIGIILRRPDSAFTEFINALKYTNQHEAVDVVDTKTTKLHLPGKLLSPRFFFFYRVICLIKVTFKLYCSNRVWDVLRVILGRNFVSDLPTLKPKKNLKT